MVQMVRPEPAVTSMSLQFALGPAYDLVLSLAAIAHPDRYELPVSWARRVRKGLPVAERRELSYFFGDPASLGVGPIQLVPDRPGTEDPATFIRELGALDPADFVAALLGRRTGGKALSIALRRMARQRGVSEVDEHHVRQYAASLKTETRKRFWEILGDPSGSRDRYVGLLRAYHDNWFASHYPEVQPFLLQRVKQGRRSIGKLPPREVVARVTGGFTLQSPSARSVTLVPSYYSAPFVTVVRDGLDVVLVYGVRPAETEGGSRPIDVQTVRVLKALADETRLRILQLLTDRPLYGQQLAEALGVSHPTISHHMAQLRIAGLTRTELAEDGSHTYSVQTEALEELCSTLRTAFVERQGPESEGER